MNRVRLDGLLKTIVQRLCSVGLLRLLSLLFRMGKEGWRPGRYSSGRGGRRRDRHGVVLLQPGRLRIDGVRRRRRID